MNIIEYLYNKKQEEHILDEEIEELDKQYKIALKKDK